MHPDFKVISFGRVGTAAINRFLSIHEEIDVPHYNTVYASLSAQVGGKANISFSDSEKIKSRGLILHQQELIGTDNSTINALKDIHTEKLLHMVRNPFEQYLSWYNYVNSSAICDANKANWAWLNTDIKTIFDKQSDIISTLKCGLQASLFYPNSDSVKLVDFNTLTADKIDQTMPDIYRYLGVNDSFSSSAFTKSQNNITTQLFEKGFVVNLNGDSIEFTLRSTENLIADDGRKYLSFCTLSNMKQILQACPSVKFEDEKIDVVVSNPPEFAKLSNNTRGLLIKHSNEIISSSLAEWARRAEICVQEFEKVKVTKLSDSDHDFIKNYLKEDLAIFTDYHPEYKDLWQL